MGEDDIQYLCDTKRLPPTEVVVARAPNAKRIPEPREGEYVVFYTHFARGFGLPASLCFHAFLEFFGLQRHDLGSNVVLQLAGFTMLCEGYLGVMPATDLWAKMFFIKQQGRWLAQCPTTRWP